MAGRQKSAEGEEPPYQLKVPYAEPSKLKEFQIVLPMDVDEYHCAQLYSVAQASKNETGGGEGIEVYVNEPFDEIKNKPDWPLLNGKYTTGQYTHKIYRLKSKVPGFVRLLAPKGSLEFHERAWNAYPYCRTVVTNPGYMRDNFYIIIESIHLPDCGTTENAHELKGKLLKKREVMDLDISTPDHIPPAEQKIVEEDPTKYHSEKTGRGPLVVNKWKSEANPVMCCYKLVHVYFKWWGLQNRVEKFIIDQYPRMFKKFHRQLFCQTDEWFGKTIEEIRKIEDETQEELAKAINDGGPVKGYSAD